MDALLNFTQFVVQALLTLVIWVVIIYAVLSWLIGFQVVNMRNRFVYQASTLLDQIVTPLLRPFRRILPTMGGLDFAPVLLLIIVAGVQSYLIPPFFAWLHGLAAAG
ncbi:MAG: YggT family protein [Caulobacteraceae bacterium]